MGEKTGIGSRDLVFLILGDPTCLYGLGEVTLFLQPCQEASGGSKADLHFLGEAGKQTHTYFKAKAIFFILFHSS